VGYHRIWRFYNCCIASWCVRFHTGTRFILFYFILFYFILFYFILLKSLLQIQGVWLQSTYLSAPNGTETSFATSVLITEAHSDIIAIISAPAQAFTFNTESQGFVFVYLYSAITDAWTLTSTLTSPNITVNSTGGSFGTAISAPHDRATLLVGEPSSGCGQLHVYHYGESGIFNLTSSLTSPHDCAEV
jgi:hypothetical protein